MKAEVTRVEKKSGIAITVVLDGVVIGKRTSKHIYRYAAIYRENRATKIAYLNDRAIHAADQAIEYDRIQGLKRAEFDVYNESVARKGIAHDGDIKFCLDSYIGGEYGKWAELSRIEAKSHLVKIEEMNADNSPLAYEIFSWHSRLDLVNTNAKANHTTNSDYIGALDIETGEII
jgi:hypothetical protein